MASVYVETTIPSFYHETRQSATAIAWRSATRLWWDKYRLRYQLFTSEYVRTELAEAPPEKSSKGLLLLDEVPILADPPGLLEVAEYYIEHQLMPVGAGGDAVHLAMASLHNLDFLLTWNCRHLANANKIRHLAVLNGRLGLHVPMITTPLSMVPEEPS